MDYISRYRSPLGAITLASDGNSLTGLWFDGQKYFAADLADGAAAKELPVFTQTARWLDIYFRGEKPDFTPPLLLRGTAFRREVWSRLLAIPYGQTSCYRDIAAALPREKNMPPASARAVGGAVGHNPISIIVPCHRVIGADGSLTGYAGGLERKRFLLALENPPVDS
ncbi:methylated-DNA--[protein]-cysteine S-methyltransferase [Lachnoclostridium sp. Marseille-P6806]|uniref:methylated-DNA--[protein]-cysteine S-methyltransferase n=1 Tax=Lachnoclostridium sp. Marseille-P6806 TaxID=2364793 RepID=UPI00103023A5|nr:methylated-DNA--[protein]-cysteine S-methyltransferase [Lachnoclostridium sp. Marseille-P6806]